MQIEQSARHISFLVKNVRNLYRQIRRFRRSFLAIDDLNTKLRHANERDIEELFDRIKQLELAVYPNLAADIKQLNRVIGVRPSSTERRPDQGEPKPPPAS